MGSYLLNAMRMNNNKVNKRPLKSGFFVTLKSAISIKTLENITHALYVIIH